MQISDLLGKYNASLTAGASEQTVSRGVEKLRAGIQDMKAGSVFEGTVGSVKNGQVTLLLGNGSSLSARLMGGVELLEGQSMFFQVKSSQDNLVEIRPFTTSGVGNPTLMQALDLAGLPVTEENVAMVNAMMEEQLPIDKNALSDMAKLLASYPQMDASSLVQMTKLNIPITPEMTAQFENYRQDEHQIINTMKEIFDELPEVLGNKELTAGEALDLNSRLVEIFTGKTAAGLAADGLTADGTRAGAFSEINGQNAAEAGTGIAGSQTAGSEAMTGTGIAGSQTAGSETMNEAGIAGNQMAGSEPMNGTGLAGDQMAGSETMNGTGLAGDQMAGSETMNGTGIADGQTTGEAFSGNGIQLTADIFSVTEQEAFAEQLTRLFGGENAENILDTVLKMSPEETLQYLNEQLLSGNPNEKAVKEFLSGKEYQSLLQKTASDQWTMRPEEFSRPDRIKELYQRLESHMQQMEQILNETGMKQSDLSKSVADVRSNIEFMNEINQAYTYLQIPLKMTGQNVHSDLYVYTNKKDLGDKDGELSAFLHLDMEHLGTTDVAVKMQGKSVNTRFYMEDDASYELICSYSEILAEKLRSKGYNCSIDAENDGKKVDFVEDFLKRGQNTGHAVHRYSFDVRA